MAVGHVTHSHTLHFVPGILSRCKGLVDKHKSYYGLPVHQISSDPPLGEYLSTFRGHGNCIATASTVSNS